MDESRVVVLTKELTSTLKVFYLFLFLLTALSIFIDLYSHLNDMIDKVTSESTILIVSYCFFCFFLFAHFMRLYFTMEELENPLSMPHGHYIASLTNDQKIKEQIIRLLLILVLSLKLIVPIFGKKSFSDLEELFLYLSIFYFVLLTWDLFMKKFHENKETYFTQNLICFCFSLVFFLILNLGNTFVSDVDKSIYTELVFICISGATFMSFYKDGRSRKLFFNQHRNKSKQTPWQHLRPIFIPIIDNMKFLYEHITSPYHGEIFKKNSGEFYEVKNKNESECDLTPDKCKYAPVNQHSIVLKNIK